LKSAEMVFNISHNMSYGKPSTSAMRNIVQLVTHTTRAAIVM